MNPNYEDFNRDYRRANIASECSVEGLLMEKERQLHKKKKKFFFGNKEYTYVAINDVS